MKKETIIVLIVAFIVLISAFFASNIYDKKKVKISNDILTKYNELYNSEELSIIYIGKDGCGFCENYTPVIKEVAKENKLTYYYVNLSKLLKKDKDTLYSTNEIFKDEKFGTPTTIIASKGKAVKYHIGYMDKDELVKFLKEAKVIKWQFIKWLKDLKTNILIQ